MVRQTNGETYVYIRGLDEFQLDGPSGDWLIEHYVPAPPLPVSESEMNDEDLSNE